MHESVPLRVMVHGARPEGQLSSIRIHDPDARASALAEQGACRNPGGLDGGGLGQMDGRGHTEFYRGIDMRQCIPYA